MHKGEIDFITLGCSKNLVDAERVMRQMEAAGWTCVHDPEEPKGEVCVINTCGFIGDAKEESINMILQMAERKKKGKLKTLIVMGCLVSAIGRSWKRNCRRWMRILANSISKASKTYSAPMQ